LPLSFTYEFGSEVVGVSADAVPMDVAVDGAGETRSSRSLLAEESEEDEFIMEKWCYNNVQENRCNVAVRYT